MWWFLIVLVAVVAAVAVVMERRRSRIGPDARNDRFKNPSRTPSWRDKDHGDPQGVSFVAVPPPRAMGEHRHRSAPGRSRLYAPSGASPQAAMSRGWNHA